MAILTLGMWGDFLPVIQTGLQTLCIIAAGRLAAARGLFDPAPVCRTLNRFVVVVCLPALQFWLLAIKTDMRNMEHWRAVGAFMLWTLLVQIACTAWVLVLEGGKLSRICVHSLVLAANNTGILAPVVLEAAVGPSAAAVGMLATIVLYFQQLPVAMVLFELDRMTKRLPPASSDRGDGDGSCSDEDGSVAIPLGEPYDAVRKLSSVGGGGGGGSSGGGVWEAAGALRGGGGGGGGSYADPWVAPKGSLWATGEQQQQREDTPVSVAAAAATSGEALATPDVIGAKQLGFHVHTAELRAAAAAGVRWMGQSVSQRALITSSPAASASPSSPASGGKGLAAGGGGDSGGGGERRAGRRWGAKTASCVWTAVGDEPGPLTAKAKGFGGGRAAAVVVAAADAAGDGVGEGDGEVLLGRTDDDSATARARAAGCTSGTTHTPWSWAVAPWATAGRGDNWSAAATPPPPPEGCGVRGGGGSDPRSIDARQPVPCSHLHHASTALRQRSHLMPLDLAAAATASPYGSCSAASCAPTAVAVGGSGGGVTAAGSVAGHSRGEPPSLRHAAQLVLGNALMWTTGAATAVSMLGLHSVLDPDVPSHVPELGFVEGTLSWLARCSVPVSLFAMGLFTASRPGCGVAGDGAGARRLAGYLAVKLLVLPWLMVFVNSLLGLDGRLARSLVVLTCVPVGQNAFLVTEQYGEGAEAVTGVMQVGLMLMLPHVAGVMAALRWMGLYQGAVA